jgi:hypothetical protein
MPCGPKGEKRPAGVLGLKLADAFGDAAKECRRSPCYA